jgi:hypothetical protein
MQWHSDARVTLEEIDEIRTREGTDHLTKFVLSLPLLLMAISVGVVYFIWQLLSANNVTLLNIFTQPIYQNGVDGKQTSIFLIIPIAAFFGYMMVCLAYIFYYWAARWGQPPLIVTNTHVRFSGKQYARHQISHFEHQHWGIHGSFAMFLTNGQIVRFPTAGVIGAPVREIDAETAKQNRDFIQSQIFVAAAAAIGAIVLLIILTSL